MISGHGVPTQVVDRPALREQLDGLLTQPVAILVAPAGAGKTVLLAQWAEHHPELAFVWIDIVGYDDYPANLAGRLVAGLAELRPELADLTRLVSAEQGGFGPLFLDALIGWMRELPPTVIVLDDLHRLKNRTILGDLVWLVDRLPDHIHLAIASRVDLPLRWARHRLRDDVTEIRGNDLAFDIEESTRLLENISLRSLTEESVRILVDRTEGWATGLQLAALTLKGRDDADSFVEQFGGTDRLVADYLGEEVLNGRAPALRMRMLLASAADEMSSELLAAMVGENHMADFLETLERESLFLVPLDSRREWFRFHQLFRDLLRYHLRAEAPEAERLLLTHAAKWYHERGDVNKAVEYLLRAKDWDAALDLIRSRGAEVYERSEMHTVIGWVTELPQSALPDRLDVTLLLGVLHALEGQLVVAEDVLRRVLIHPDASDGQRMVAQTILAARAQWSPHPESSAEIAARAISLLEAHPDASPPDVLGITDRSSLTTLALLSGGRSLFLSGDLAESRRWLERALRSDGASFSPWRVGALGSLALLEAWCGRTRVAEELGSEALDLSEQAELTTHSVVADAHLALALVAEERAEPERASWSLREGVARAAGNGRTQLLWVGHLIQVQVRETDGDGGILPTPPPGGPPPAVVRDRLNAVANRARRLEGHSPATATVETDTQDDAPSMLFELVATALTHGRLDRAHALLESAPVASAEDTPLVLVERLILQAWLADAEGHVGIAESHLLAAVTHAEQHDLVSVFLRAGPAVIARLQELPGPRSGFLERILDRARAALGALPTAALPEPLTQRELEILSHLPSRATNVELAERFYVSVNTVKTHIVHIYRKLDAPNRSEAIRRARELGLLP
ncbi:LuxR C-terminal-related transcriptional regulator [Leifsonia sp. NPDC058230]|uniref:LuxR C-terminal-related transcriptional regulator n=1 Tax=Leifsonia sp. NPDC058230 TaxID=3346391 RepID=UPI0036D9DFF1